MVGITYACAGAEYWSQSTKVKIRPERKSWLVFNPWVDKKRFQNVEVLVT